MKYVIQAPNGDYLHPDNTRTRYIADHGGQTTYGPFWTKDITKAEVFETWTKAEARAGILFWNLEQSDFDFRYMDTIKALDEKGGK